METTALNKTPLYSLHNEQGASMVPFAGYEMPVQYANGVKQEHLHTRKHAGLFDISHMGQVRLFGDNAAEVLEALVPSNIKGLAEQGQCYTVLTNKNGGIIDDLMVTNADDHLFIVINAACKENDINYIRSQLPDSCELEELTDFALLALQGPKAVDAMQRLCAEATELTFMSGKQFNVKGTNCFINRCGYTGEDGFEISIPEEHVENIARYLLAEDEVELIGLGARDSLRLEAGYCLYGHDLDETTSPVEANINWVISKTRLQDNTNSFPGMEIIREQLQHGTERRRVGILSEGKAPIREGASVFNEQEQIIGTISSGGFGPSVEKPIAMAYINQQYATIGTQLIVKVRDRVQHVKVVPLPFVEHRYYRK